MTKSTKDLMDVHACFGDIFQHLMRIKANEEDCEEVK